MDTFLQLISALRTDLNINENSTLYPLATLKLAINRAYRKAGALYRWPETEDAKKTSTIAGQEYYDYPDNWRPDSMSALEIDGVPYGEGRDHSPLTFDDYRQWRDDPYNSGSTDKKWSTQWRRFFVYPVPTTNGDNNMSIYGQKVVAELVADADITIFSYSMPECNDAIVIEAKAILKNQGENIQNSQFQSAVALKILGTSWAKIAREQQKYEKNLPFLDVVDMFPPPATTSNDIGKFDV